MILKFLKANAHHIKSLALFWGFFFDAFTLPNVTSVYSYLIGIFYATLVGCLIIFRELVVSRRLSLPSIEKVVTTLIFLISFFTGSLMGFVFIYYLRGGDVAVVFPVLLFILVIMLINEFSKSTDRTVLDIIVYGISIVFLFIFMVPVLFKSMGDYVFVTSLVFASIFLYLYGRLVYKIKRGDIIKLHRILIIIPILLLSLYFTNILPAVPLTIREHQIYGSEILDKAKYTFENPCKRSLKYLYLRCGLSKDTTQTNRVSYYVEIQAPTDLTANVTHKWEFYNENTKKWESVGNVTYKISGGREKGYRGYSSIEVKKTGLYKVSVVINGKRHLGSKKFYVR